MTDTPIPRFTVSLSRQDWSLHRKGPIDQARHTEKVKEAIRDNLADIISEQAIITSDGTKIVKVPIRSLEEYKFRFGEPPQGGQVGQGEGDTQVGDVIDRVGQPGAGSGPGAGEQPGIDYYEAELTLDELAALVFDDLGLPRLEEKRAQILESETVEFSDIRRHGPFANLDKKRTIRENLKRNALRGQARFGDLKDDDLRFKTWERAVRRESNAVVLALMDVSGCHTAGHHVEMADGSYKDVSEIVVGDLVACLDLATREKRASRVVETFSKVAPATLVIETEDATLRATPEHRYFVYDEPNNQLVEKYAAELRVGDQLVLINSWGSTSTSQAATLTEDRAYMLGVLLGDGYIFVSANSSYITVTDEDEARLVAYQETFERAFGVRGLLRNRPGAHNRRRVHFNCAPLARELVETYPMLKRRSRQRYIESSIYREAPVVRAAFLRGLFDAEGSIAHHSVVLFSASRRLLTQVKHLLSYWGIRARVNVYEQGAQRMGQGKAIRADTFYRLSINAKDVLIFAEHIGFGCQRKRAKLRALVVKQAAGINTMRGKYILGDKWRERFAHLPKRTRLSTYRQRERHALSRQQLLNLAGSPTATLDDQRYIEAVLQRRMLVSRVREIERDADSVQVYDFGVADHHNYIVDGILSHNSMGAFEKYISRAFYFWMVRFLRTTYANVEIVFIAHHTEAKEVTEEEFFTRGESGGTKASSAYRLALDIVDTRYPASDWNIYPFHFSDGDNWPSDNDECLALAEALLARANQLGYGEIRPHRHRYGSTLLSAFERITDPKFQAVIITDKTEVYPALRAFFARDDAAAQHTAHRTPD